MLKDGRRLLIGSQRAEELEEAMRRAAAGDQGGREGRTAPAPGAPPPEQ